MSAIPVTLLTGFLGAGKTTLLNALLARPELSRSAVVINEFGQIGIDHLLVEAVQGDLMVLTTGCICCTARGALLDAVRSLLDRREAGLIDFSQLVIETTGIADPAPILQAIDVALRPSCRIDAVVAVVDVLSGAETLDAEPEARHQVVLADVLVLSKTDLGGADPAARSLLEDRLRHLNPHAAIVVGQERDAVAAALVAPIRTVLGTSGLPRHRHHHHEAAAVCLSAGRIDPRLFEQFVGLLLSRHGSAVLRLKGIVASTEDPELPIIVQAAGSTLYPAERLSTWPDLDRNTRIVVIVRSMPPAQITELWDAFFGPPAIDRPDAAGLLMSSASGPGLF